MFSNRGPDDYSLHDDPPASCYVNTDRTWANDAEDEDPTESSPLLSKTVNPVDIDELLSNKRHRLSRNTVLLIFFCAVCLAGCADQIMDSPMSRIYEAVICYRYYEHADPTKIQIGREAVGPGAIGGVEEMWCKVDPVQSELAMLRGYQQLFDGFPALLLAIPFGAAADRWGRKPFMILGLLSFLFRSLWIQAVLWFWQAFDIRMTWLSTLHGLMSGSSPVVTGLFFVMLSDVTHESERATVFLRISAVSIAANLAMPPLGAWLMRYNPWIPAIMGTLFIVVTCLVITVTPETLGYLDHSRSRPRT